MHPILGDRARLALYLGSWAPAAVILVLFFAVGGASWSEALLTALPLVPPLAFICLSPWYLVRALPLPRTPVLRVLGNHIAASVLSASLWLALGRGWAALLEPSMPGTAARMAAQSPLLLAAGALLYLLAGALHYVAAAIDDTRDAERRALDVKVLAREAELTALRAQLQPHFLFNALNSISALTTVDPASARRMCLLLSDFLRRSLAVGTRAVIPLRDELSLLSTYLEVEKVRFGDRLAVSYDVDPAAEDVPVPPLLLQPLVENAVTHGIAHLLDGGTITLRAQCRGDRLEIDVRNPCDPERERAAGNGVGLANVERRLAAAYDRDASFDARERDGTYHVALTLPVGG